jgi:GrpB-like predicted nucleotidyltransferase (UPF0157 family)
VNEVLLVEYNVSWQARFEAVRAEIELACGDRIVCVEHVGSTAIPGMAAKPIIDVQPGLRAFDDGFVCVEPMTALGYESRGEWGIPGRHYFVRDEPDGLRLHVHMLVVDSERWHEMPLFRDYLRAHVDEARAYEALKRRLAEEFRTRRDLYTDAKADFVQAALERASKWDAADRPAGNASRQVV